MSQRLKNRSDARSALFGAYAGSQESLHSNPYANPQSSSRTQSPYGKPSPSSYGSSPYQNGSPNGPSFGAYPTAGPSSSSGGFRPATPNTRGQYSDAVLESLESQNDEHIE
ncbi:hypothetical protein LTS18_001948, partial [Coniosporium uncinatum]